VVNDAERAWVRDSLVWAVRFIAAEPDASLELIERERISIDELALTLDDYLPLAREEGLVGTDAMEVLDEIDAVFDAMSGPEHADQWTDVTVRSGAEWAAQRERARQVLRLMGEPRADEELSGHI
jgi:hypothetical protein